MSFTYETHTSRDSVKAMQRFVDTMVGIEKFSYPAKRNAPRPKKAFCSIALVEQYEVGLPITIRTDIKDINTDEVIGGHYKSISAVTLRYRLSFIGTDGTPALKVKHGWTRQDVIDLMYDYGYGYLHSFPTGLEDRQHEKEWEEGQGMSVLLSGNAVLEECIPDIIVVEPIRGCFIDGGKVIEVELKPSSIGVNIN